MPSAESPVFRLGKAFAFSFSPDAKRVAFIAGRRVTMLDLGTRGPLFAVQPVANPAHIDFSPDGSYLVVKGTSGRTVVLDARTGRLRRDFRNQKEGEGGPALFSACSRFVVSVSWRGVFGVRDVESAAVVFSRSHDGCQLSELSCTADRGLFVYSVNGSPRTPDGPTPCTVALCRWPVDGAKAGALPGKWTAIWGLQVSPTGRFIAVVHGTPPDTLEIHDIRRSRTVARCAWSGGPGCALAWSSDETTLLTNGDDCFRVHAVPRLKVVRELPSPYPCFARFSPDDAFVALGSWKRSTVLPVDRPGGGAKPGNGAGR